ncbi:MAG: succinate dehydrogenase/fumarate reductase iron-sulfur subunit [Caldilineaceae bacterium]
MKLHLQIWRQKSSDQPGQFVNYDLDGVSPDASFLEMLDKLNEELQERGEEPVAFDHDCREGICGTCGMMINGIAHGPKAAVTTCQLHMRSFKDGDTIVIEPWRARPFPVLRDLIVNRTAFDRIIQAGGYISVSTGSAPDANAIPIPKTVADRSMDAAACIGCGACVAACPNGSAMLFTAAKVGHLNLLPQGKTERYDRAVAMTKQHDAEGFGGCTNIRECEAACPKEISIDFISLLNRDLLIGSLTGAGKR